MKMLKDEKNADKNDGTKVYDFFDFAFQSEDAPADKYYNWNINGNTEPLAESSKNNDEAWMKVMSACLFFSRTIKPILIVLFVLFYWGSGLIRTYQRE